MNIPQPITEARLEQQKANMKTVIREAIGIRLRFGGVIQGGNSGITEDELHARFQGFLGTTEQSAAGNLRVINLMKPNMLGPAERKFVSDIAAYGLALLRMINGGALSTQDPKQQKHIQQRVTRLFDEHPDLMVPYSKLSEAVNQLAEDFPPTPLDQKPAMAR